MIKISALNEESSDDSDSEEEVTREALEQIALQQYARALELQRRGELDAALSLLSELLDTDLLHETPPEKHTEPLYNLKYLCHKNAAGIQQSLGDTDAALRSYCAAAKLDHTDVTLWHRLGSLCVHTERYEMALHAFQRGVERNPRHWPCLDKIVTLLLSLKHYEDCIITIHDALNLDPGYLRGIVYRQHIYKENPYIRDFMSYIDPKYKWTEEHDDPIDEIKALKLLEEAEYMGKIYLQHLKSEQYKYSLPELQLKKPITSLEWKAVGESLVHMHNYMAEHYFSHACIVNVVFEKENKDDQVQLCEEDKKVEVILNKDDEQMEVDENVENGSENENNDLSDKATDNERVESDLDAPQSEAVTDANQPQGAENKNQNKKTPIRRRGSALSFLQQWEWCNKRRSGRKKPTTLKQEKDDTIYDTLRRMVPPCLMPDIIKKKEDNMRDISPDTMDLFKLFEERESIEQSKQETLVYFGTDSEQNDVLQFIDKYKDNACDIIEMLREFLSFLASKWQLRWPEGLSSAFLEANSCYNTHIDPPSCIEENNTELVDYVTVNLLSEEFKVNDILQSSSDDKQIHDLNVIETIDLLLCSLPQIFGSECLQLMLRQLWVKLHSHIINKNDEFALDSLYRLLYEFNAMGEHHDSYSLEIINFSFKPDLTENEVFTYVKFLERNKQLSAVMKLYERGNYEEVLSIVIDSFEHCKTIARKQEEEMSLDFAAQLSLILDCYWALNKVEECFKWSLICLHEALEHYTLFAAGSSDHNRWSLTIEKILCCMEHILTTEGLSCLEATPQKELSLALEDLTQVIGYQIEKSAKEMPFGTVAPWIVMHYILQREDDHGRSRRFSDKDKVASDEIPNPLMILFIAHEQLGMRGWCCTSDAKLLYFILDTVVPRLRSPSLSRSLEQICQYMEQCVSCLFNHPGKKKLKYLTEHNVNPRSLDWTRAQQLYEIFRPVDLPEVEGKMPSISADTEQLFQKILDLVPTDCNPQKYISDMEKYISGKETKLPAIPPLLPYKMKDIYFLLGDYYFKKEDSKKSVKYNMYDIIVNNDRFESWAEIALAKAVNLELKVNSCYNMDNDKEYFKPVQSTVRCFKRALELDTGHCNLWIEYGVFTYTVHSFCSRLLKQASESLSMEDFESLEKQKEDMLNVTHKCFVTVIQDLNNSHDSDKANDEMWLHYYMLGKVAEKQNRPPAVYISHYIKAVKSLEETDALYPQKINYKTPPHLSFEVLELHYRIHASILKYIEQHENKPISMSVGKVFLDCINKWRNGPYSKRPRKEGTADCDADSKPGDAPSQAANILKRSVSDAGEEDNSEAKRMKLESAAAKVRRSASYDTDLVSGKEVNAQNGEQNTTDANETQVTSTEIPPQVTDKESVPKVTSKESVPHVTSKESVPKVASKESVPQVTSKDSVPQVTTSKESVPQVDKGNDVKKSNATEIETKCLNGEAQSTVEKKTTTENKDESSSGTCSSGNSSSESSDSSSSESSSDSSRDSDASDAPETSNSTQPLGEDKIMDLVAACLDALEDCSAKFPQHYKALYRLAHYHFYYKKGKDIERCRDLMLSNFTSRSNQKLGGLFVERKQNNFFNGIWRIPTAEVDRTGGFAAHMNRCVLLTMEILKEIDDHKTLLDLSLHLQRTPEPDKKYLRDADRQESAQQAFSLCVQSLKGQLTKFSQQADLKSNDVERKAFDSLMLDIYRAYQRAQKQPGAKQLTNLLVEAYKLVSTHATENINFVDASMRYCQALIATLRQQATQASLDKNNMNNLKKQVRPEPAKSAAVTNHPRSDQSKTASIPVMSAQEMAASYQNYLPMLNEPLVSQQAAALSLSYLNTLAGYTALQSSLGSYQSLQTPFQTEFYRQLLGSNSFGSFSVPPPKKQKRSKPPVTKPHVTAQSGTTILGALNHQNKEVSKSFCGVGLGHNTKTVPVTSALSKSNSAPSSTSSLQLPAPSSVAQSSAALPAQAHLATTSTASTVPHNKPPLPHQQLSPGKTLQEKLAERQKHLPSKTSSTSMQDINSSMSRLPSALTITKSNKPAIDRPRETETNPPRPKPLTSDEVIVLDDD